jgi:hypothetical protein
MTEQDPPRMRELPLRDSELSDLLDAASNDVMPRDVLARSAERLSAAVGVSAFDLTGLGSPPIDAAASALASQSAGAAAAAKTAAAVKGAATVATATAATGKSAAVLAPLLSAAVKPLLVVALASATTVAVWSARPEPSAAPQATPSAAPQSGPARVAATTETKPPRAHPNIDAYAVPAVAPTVTELPSSQRATSPRSEPRPERRSQPEARASENVAPAPTVDPSSAAAEELRSLQAAQAELATSPASAVQRLRAHAAKWPRGWLDEERAALLVEALLRAGDRAAAERALEDLRTRSPRAPALPRLRRMLEQDTLE